MINMEFADLLPYNGKETITVNGEVYRFGIQQDSGGLWAIWTSRNRKFKIMATLNYDIRGVPVSVEDKDGDPINSAEQRGEVKDFREYKAIVERLASNIIKRYVAEWEPTGKAKAGKGDESGEIFCEWKNMETGEKRFWLNGKNPNKIPLRKRWMWA